ncbi:MAG: multidrug efflux SMR transporter [Myxococcota bacterium]
MSPGGTPRPGRIGRRWSGGPMSGWGWLMGAIVAEVSATAALRASDGLTRLGPVAVVIAGYALAFALLSRSLTELPLGVAYAVWSGLGTAGAVAIGWALFGERVGWHVVVGVGLVVAGISVLHLGALDPGPAR